MRWASFWVETLRAWWCIVNIGCAWTAYYSLRARETIFSELAGTRSLTIRTCLAGNAHTSKQRGLICAWLARIICFTVIRSVASQCWSIISCKFSWWWCDSTSIWEWLWCIRAWVANISWSAISSLTWNNSSIDFRPTVFSLGACNTSSFIWVRFCSYWAWLRINRSFGTEHSINTNSWSRSSIELAICSCRTFFTLRFGCLILIESHCTRKWCYTFRRTVVSNRTNSWTNLANWASSISDIWWNTSTAVETRWAINLVSRW